VVLQLCTEHEIITLPNAPEAVFRLCRISERKSSNLTDARLDWQLTTGRITPPRRAAPITSRETSRWLLLLSTACRCQAARLLSATETKSPRKHGLAYTAFTPAKPVPVTDIFSAFWVLCLCGDRRGAAITVTPIESHLIPDPVISRACHIDFTHLLSRNPPVITTKKAPRIPRLKTSQKGRKDAQGEARRARWLHCHARMK
jgi:hypothetical protein